MSLDEVLRQHPEMRVARRGLRFNSWRLRRLLRGEGSNALLVFDNGRQFRVAYEALSQLRDSLELAQLFALEPYNPDLWTYKFGDLPFELNLCDGARLRELFSDMREFIRQFLWQNIYYRRLGLEMGREYFAKALLRVHSKVRVIALVDYDPGGWWAAQTLVKHLRRLGVECDGEPVFVVPGRGWFGRTGGIGGEKLTIHANWLRPPSRVRAVLEELLG